MNSSVLEPCISILIVGYNSNAFIGDCLDSIAHACADISHEILLIDNGDGSTEELVREKFPDVSIVQSRGNIGFGPANNLLASKARGAKYLLVNPDMVLPSGSIEALLQGSRDHPDAAAWGGVTTNAQGQPDSGNAIAMPSILEFFSVALGRSLVGIRPIKGAQSDAPVSILSGAYVMFDKAAWDVAGGFDERYFLYCEEVDLFFRLAQRGYTFWRIASARGHHKAGHGDDVGAMRLLYRAAGTMEFTRTHWSRPGWYLAAFLTWIAAIERYLAGRLFGGFSPRLKAMSDGYRLVALKPDLWRYGYDQERGLLSKIGSISKDDL
ncbi:glycosyltransferase family 2 protein [Erythrobacter insulae]|uniref:Glycosyltransferase family 2 protein n=2 Tax=Erythrobacter insulae TaxID=2584124 RepID=A0A547PF53_9SPHN|nr:glycosyltransferase family 2 protein [Erythrobacter insulae]